MNFANIPDRMWGLIFTVVFLITAVWLLMGWAREEKARMSLVRLILDESHSICAYCLEDEVVVSYEDEHMPRYLPPSQRNPDKALYTIQDHEFCPLYLVDIGRLTRDPENWEAYGRHIYRGFPHRIP